MIDFNEQKARYIKQINEELDGYLSADGNDYDNVIEAMRYSVMDAGKRIRPIMTLEWCRLNGGDVRAAMPFACAIELIHCYSLIHDDLPCMDNDDLRRGKPSCHKKFDETTALLAGDALLTKAFEIAVNAPISKLNPRAALKCAQELSYYAGIDGMIGGQAMDLKQDNEISEVTETSLQKTYDLKTSALIKCACEMGAIAADAMPQDILNAEIYGENLGAAFQIIDDILDVEGDEKALGKPIGSDQNNGKSTITALCGAEHSKALAKEYTDKAMEVVGKYSDNDFLKALTESLLNRQN